MLKPVHIILDVTGTAPAEDTSRAHGRSSHESPGVSDPVCVTRDHDPWDHRGRAGRTSSSHPTCFSRLLCS